MIFWVFCGYFWIDYHIRYWTLDPENVTHHHHHHPPIFSDFLAIFWLFLNRLPYLDLDPGPCKHYPPSSPPSPNFFSDFSAILLPFFIQISAHFHIWKCALDPENSTPTSSLTVSTIPSFFFEFFPILLLLFFWKSAHFHIWKCAFGP